MKRIRTLTEEEISALEYGYKYGKKHYFRIKCKSLLMSNDGNPVSEIAEFARKTTRSIRNWINDYEYKGLNTLTITPGRGMKAVLDSLSDEQIQLIKDEIKDDPQNITSVGAKLSKKLGFKVTKWMLKRFVKKNSITLGEESEKA